MTDQEYVESTVAYLAEHVPWMWHKFAAWLLREVCRDQPEECLAIADLHDRWRTASEEEWGKATTTAVEWAMSVAESAARSSATSAASSATSPVSSVRGASGSAVWVARSAATTPAAARAAGSTADSMALSQMAKWLLTESNPKGDPLVSADWWEERGEPKLAELLRQAVE